MWISSNWEQLIMFISYVKLNISVNINHPIILTLEVKLLK